MVKKLGHALGAGSVWSESPVDVGAGELDLWEGSHLHQESAQNPRLEPVAQHGGRNA